MKGSRTQDRRTQGHRTLDRRTQDRRTQDRGTQDRRLPVSPTGGCRSVGTSTHLIVAAMRWPSTPRAKSPCYSVGRMGR